MPNPRRSAPLIWHFAYISTLISFFDVVCNISLTNVQSVNKLPPKVLDKAVEMWYHIILHFSF